MRYIISFLLASTAMPALADVPNVVTDIPPVHSLAAAVMGDLGKPVLLLDRGASPHGFQLKPSQVGAVSDADLVLWIGPELSPWLQKALDARPAGADALALLAAPGTYRQDFAAPEHGTGDDDDDHAEHDHDHADEADHDHAEHDHDDHDGHSHSGLDPHAWLDPANGKLWAGLIADELSRLDPENAATYAANAIAAAAAIDAAEAEAAALLAPAKDRPLVAFHDAYGYFTAHFGLTMIGTIAAGDAAAPGARHLVELQERTGTTACLFPEAQHDPALLTRLAEATGARVGGALDPEGSGLEPGPALYPALITALARTIAACAP
ncbi:zinc ABC transporter substrate-binding protein [Rhodobacter sp.]